MPQMPAYHLVRSDHSGITMVNIGVGPSNAKNITDHIAVLRPHAWIMLGHCAGLRTTQQLGDYVLAHGYVREDHVLDEELPLWVPIPPLAEVQLALEQAVAEITQLEGFELKRVMRTGTVASTDNRNWELLPHPGPERRFSQSRAIALDMESAAIAANGFRFRVPYGTLLCVSDKPLHGEIKLPGMANHFYRERVEQHLRIGIRALELLRGLGVDRVAQPQAARLRRGRVPVGRRGAAPPSVVRRACPGGLGVVILRGVPGRRRLDAQVLVRPSRGSGPRDAGRRASRPVEHSMSGRRYPDIVVDSQRGAGGRRQPPARPRSLRPCWRAPAPSRRPACVETRLDGQRPRPARAPRPAFAEHVGHASASMPARAST